MKFFNLKYILISLVVLLFIFSSFSNVIKGERIAVLEINGVIENPKIYLINLEKIKSNKNIKGLIVRVNSPGGTVGSSQEIYNTLKELRPGLPIVASIVDIGASGGYMISCGAEHIMANSGSITGSIGVISQYYNLSELLKFIKLDIEVLKSGKFKDTSSITKALSAEEKELINNLLIDIHEQFKEIVKIERKLNSKEIEIVSKGQIFTGKQAKELKLIDSLGGLNNAKQYIENKIGLTDLELDYYPKKKEKLIDKFIPSALVNKEFYRSITHKILYLYSPGS
ncbi:MAG: signal peptide peptidase SppA [Thermodesulfobacteriota bacterium]